MSSFLGHSVAAITVYVATESNILLWFNCAKGKKNFLTNKKQSFLWLLWLIIIASVPDVDYVVEPWRSHNNQGLRITYSVLFSLIIPGLTIGILVIKGIRGKKLLLPSLQVILAGLSHLILDSLVGVTPLPLLFPITNVPFKLPFGILPSAGKIDLNNYYFYRNLKLEMGVLLPILSLILLWRDRFLNLPKNYLLKAFLTTLLVICCIYFIHLNLALPR